MGILRWYLFIGTLFMVRGISIHLSIQPSGSPYAPNPRSHKTPDCSEIRKVTLAWHTDFEAGEHANAPQEWFLWFIVCDYHNIRLVVICASFVDVVGAAPSLGHCIAGMTTLML